MERARACYRERAGDRDMELFRHLDNRRRNRQTNGLTELFLKSASQPKNYVNVLVPDETLEPHLLYMNQFYINQSGSCFD